LAVLLDLRVPADEKTEASKTATFTAKDWPAATEWILPRTKV
jgi:hypothetical protein